MTQTHGSHARASFRLASPAAPAEGQRYYRTDLDAEFEYSAGRWLPVPPVRPPWHARLSGWLRRLFA